MHAANAAGNAAAEAAFAAAPGKFPATYVNAQGEEVASPMLAMAHSDGTVDSSGSEQ